MSINNYYRSFMNKEDRERIIIEAALKVFSNKGYANTRMADIAAEAGMSYGLVYHYFQNKEKLFNSIVDEGWRSYYAEIERLKDSQMTVEKKIEGIVKYLLGRCVSHPEQVSLFMTEVSRGFVYHADVSSPDMFQKLFALMDEIIQEGQREKIFRKDIKSIQFVYALTGIIDAFLSIIVFGKEKMGESRKKKMIKDTVSIFLSGARNIAR